MSEISKMSEISLDTGSISLRELNQITSSDAKFALV